MTQLFHEADEIRARIEAGEVIETHKGRVLTLLFHEPSTRTRCSFQAAMLRLAGRVMVVDNPAASSAKKGETLEDTVRCLSRYSDALVLRHPDIGSAARAARVSACPVINAGDGAGEHPTQALLDLYSMARELAARRGVGEGDGAVAGLLDGINVCVLGDLQYGRTVHSLLQALARFNDVTVYCCPAPGLGLPPEVSAAVGEQVRLWSTDPADGLAVASLSEAVAAADVIYVTRVQRERLPPERHDENLQETYPAVSPAWLDRLGARPDVLVLHPLPREHEVSTELDNDPRAGYFDQMTHGMYLRMALLCRVLARDEKSARRGDEPYV